MTVASAAQTLAVPQVLRLKIYAYVPHRRTPAWTRHGVFERDDYTCAYCGRRYPVRDLDGGSPHPSIAGRGLHLGQHGRGLPSLQSAQGGPHAARGGHEAAERAASFRIEPKAPRTSYLVASGDVPAAWKVWIES